MQNFLPDEWSPLQASKLGDVFGRDSGGVYKVEMLVRMRRAKQLHRLRLECFERRDSV